MSHEKQQLGLKPSVNKTAVIGETKRMILRPELVGSVSTARVEVAVGMIDAFLFFGLKKSFVSGVNFLETRRDAARTQCGRKLRSGPRAEAAANPITALTAIIKSLILKVSLFPAALWYAAPCYAAPRHASRGIIFSPQCSRPNSHLTY